MSGHSHDHGGHSHSAGSGGGAGGHGGDCGHENGHEHFTHEAGEQQSLYQVVDKDNVAALNAESDEMGKAIIKPWDQLEDDTLYCQSEDDGELLIRVPFTDTVKLRSITLRIGGGDAKMPDKMHVYANASPDFSDLSATTPTQSFDLVASPSAMPYHVRVAKFSSITHLTLHFPPPTTSGWEEGDPVRLTYLSFAGEALRLRREVPTGVMYEANANLKDHKVPDSEQGNWTGLGQ